jgi:lysophospholipase L1-like esterase
MKISSSMLAMALALPAAASLAAPLPPVRVILVGDSTMASHSGYGDALCARFTPEVKCVNLAKGGRSSSSFRAEHRWDEVQKMLGDAKGYAATYVLVQFGHNDQPGKGERSTDLVTQFPANMARYAAETRALGGVPVLVTPLTRRGFKGAYLHDDLGPWAAATRKAAAQEHAAVLDLNADSSAAVQAMGQAEADTLAMEPPPKDMPADLDPVKIEHAGVAKTRFDRTHLGAKGSAYFANMVAGELAHAVPALKPYLKK